MTQVTQLLQRMHAGEAAARDALFAAAYEELRRLARSRLRDGGRNTVLETVLSPTRPRNGIFAAKLSGGRFPAAPGKPSIPMIPLTLFVRAGEDVAATMTLPVPVEAASLHVGLHLHDDLLQELKWVR